MLRLKPNLLLKLRRAQTQADLYGFIHAAIQLEHATIPPYLTALYSLKPGTNTAASNIITSIVREEMLHMTIAANLLIALGGRPCFSAPRFVPDYPGPLPMQVDDDLQVGLQPCSKKLLYDTFMRLEQPDKPPKLKLKDGGETDYPDAATGEYPTIGDFYKELLVKLSDMNVTWGPASAQVTQETTGTTWFRETDWFPITSLDDAARAVEVIVTEGEGATASPVDGDGDPAHFYRFGEIYYGAKLIPEGASWSYTGADVPFDESAVFPMTPNAKATMYPVGTRSRLLVDGFNQAYRQLLLGLDSVFNGQQQRLNTTLGLMYQLRILAYEVLTQPDPNSTTGDSTGLTFEYVPLVIV
ncbi:ferritin-like protein [Corallococcus exiguus]|uniref:ferritin-like domain-containing protein n=1 Tax=Corallococcus exiguus TaxID=83462 RepID=UPI001A8BFE37|nr:ferritin-like protein [Corallococcus exiguus]MBN8465794.1 ferritin-like protein [Corallococcus exiguus]